MTIAVTGAGGQLGRHAVAALLDRGVPAGEIVAVVRDPAKAAYAAERGVRVAVADYADAAALRAAFDSVDKVLFISGSEVGARLSQHRNIVDAAREAGVEHVAYTSILRADTSKVGLAAEHLTTEGWLRESGLATTMLRNGWYWENYTASLPATIEHRALLGCAGDGIVSAAARRDYAEAAAVVLTSEGHEEAVYELAGDEPLTFTALAKVISEVSGVEVEYRELAQADYVAALESAGLPHAVAEMLADCDAGIARGDLESHGDDLQRLIGRTSTPAAEVLRAAL